MCTLSYYPTGKSSYWLTHNRDELRQRGIAYLPDSKKIHGRTVIFPQDPDAGGTWIAMSKEVNLCLLNGAFERYRHSPPYTKSRGQVLLDVFQFSTFQDFIEQYDLEGVAPFTLIVAENRANIVLHDFRWDGLQKHHSICLSDQAHIWSAATLYLPEVRLEREEWYAAFLDKNKEITDDQLIDFHRFGGVGDREKDLVVNKKYASTVSISQIRHQESQSLWYYDLINNREIECPYLEP